MEFLDDFLLGMIAGMVFSLIIVLIAFRKTLIRGSASLPTSNQKET